MRVFLNFLFTTSLLITFFSIKAQEINPQKVTIKVLDSIRNIPIPFATIRFEQNKKITVTLTDTNGVFNLNVDKGTLISLSALGYVTKNFNVADLEEFKIIRLETQITNLKEVTVIATKPLVKQEIDRLIFDVQALPNLNDLNSFDLLNKVPLLNIGMGGQVLINGSSKVRILVNGRKSTIANVDTENYLRGLEAKDVLKIEVITSPPSKYDAEGLSLLNIILKKQNDDGYKASVSSRTSIPGLVGSSANFDIKSKSVGITAFASYNFQNLPESLNELNRINENASSILNQNGTSRNKFNTLRTGVDLNYELGSNNLINISSLYSISDLSKTIFFNSILNQSGEVKSYQFNSFGSNENDSYNFSFNYQNEGKNDKNKILTIAYQNLKGNLNQVDSILPFNQINSNIFFGYQQSNSTTLEQSLQADYEYPFNKGIAFELGSKLILRKNLNDTFNDAWLLEDQSDKSSTNDGLNHYQNVFSNYLSMIYKKKNWSIKSGIRLENTNFGASFSQLNASNSFNERNLNFIPSLLYNFRNKKGNSYNIEFSRRIERPSIYQLNPFLNVSNPQLYFSGNPTLTPIVFNSFDATYGVFKKSNYRVGINMISANNTITNIYTVTPNGIPLSTFDNVGKFLDMKLSLYYSKTFFEDLDLSINTRLGYTKIEGVVNGLNQIDDGFTFGIISNGYYFINKNWSMNYYFNFSSPSINLQRFGAWFYQNSIGVNRSFLNKKISTSFSFLNPFTKYQYFRTTTNYLGILENSISNVYTRQVAFSASYRFGKLKSQLKQPKKKINNNDLRGEN